MPEYEDLTGPDGTYENIGGTQQRIYFASKHDFETIQPVPVFGAGATLDEEVNIVGDHAMVTGKKLTELYVEMDTGKLMGAIQGGRGGKSIKVDFDFLHIGPIAKQLGLQRKLKDDRLLFFIPLADGTVVQVGTEEFPAEASPSFTAGDMASEVRGLNVKVESSDRAVWIYSGVLPLTPAV